MTESRSQLSRLASEPDTAPLWTSGHVSTSVRLQTSGRMWRTEDQASAVGLLQGPTTMPFDWTTDNDPSLQHDMLIDRGAYGEIHKVIAMD